MTFPEFPELDVVDKSRTILRRLPFIGVTIGRKVYVDPAYLPGGARAGELVDVLAHEAIHATDQARWGVIFFLTYFLPLPIGPLSLRVLWEWRAYRGADLARAVRARGYLPELTRLWLVRTFTGGAYLFMWPFRRHMERLIARAAAEELAKLPGRGLDDEGFEGP